jgi:phosphoribosylanthranilate isomerase
MRTRLKICGLTRPEDVDAAIHAGADALGFVFYPPSPRAVSAEQAATLIRRTPPFVETVGLFVNEDPATVQYVCEQVPLSLLQFHGDESPEYCAQFARPYIKAARVRPGLDLLEFARAFADARAILLDAFVEGFGGSGKTFDWQLIPSTLPVPIILSGGLNERNVAEAIRQVKPLAVDVSSGVEASKGIKDHVKIAAFVAAISAAQKCQGIKTR